jgi:hypothetical protein
MTTTETPEPHEYVFHICREDGSTPLGRCPEVSVWAADGHAARAAVLAQNPGHEVVSWGRFADIEASHRTRDHRVETPSGTAWLSWHGTPTRAPLPGRPDGWYAQLEPFDGPKVGPWPEFRVALAEAPAALAAPAAPAPASGPREYAPEEVKAMFLDHVRALARYWGGASISGDKSLQERLDGLAFSILSTIDGCSDALPAFILAPRPHESDRDHLRGEGLNWFPENHGVQAASDISGCLHDSYYRES